MKKWLNFGLAGILSVWMNGCASIIGKSAPQSITLDSVPAGANVLVNDRSDGRKVFEGVTPTLVKLDKKKSFFSGRRYEVIISKEGYRDSVVYVSPRVGGWYLLGNLVFGGPIGWLIVDPASGAMWNLSPDKINETLGAKQAESRLSPDEIRVVLLEQVPQTLRGEMVPITR